MVDNNTTGNASAPNGPNSSTMPEGNSVVLPHAHTTIMPEGNSVVLPHAHTTIMPEGNSVVLPHAHTTIVPEGNSAVLPHAHTTITPSSSTLSPSMSAMAIPTIPTSLPPLTAIVSKSEKENRWQDTEPGMDLMPSGSSLSVGSISNSVQSGQRQSLPKRVKGLAVVGTRLTDKCVISQ